MSRDPRGNSSFRFLANGRQPVTLVSEIGKGFIEETVNTCLANTPFAALFCHPRFLSTRKENFLFDLVQSNSIFLRIRIDVEFRIHRRTMIVFQESKVRLNSKGLEIFELS